MWLRGFLIALNPKMTSKLVSLTVANCHLAVKFTVLEIFIHLNGNMVAGDFYIAESKNYGSGCVEHNRLAWKHDSKVIYYFIIVI